MSSSADGRLFVNTALLREHVNDIREERRIVLQLRDAVSRAKNYGDPGIQPLYNSVISSLTSFSNYFEKMADAVETINDDAVALSQNIRQQVEAGIADAAFVASKIQL